MIIQYNSKTECGPVQLLQLPVRTQLPIDNDHCILKVLLILLFDSTVKTDENSRLHLVLCTPLRDQLPVENKNWIKIYHIIRIG